MNMLSLLLNGLLLLLVTLVLVQGHGRLIEPPARSTAWRYGYPMPVNYNDNELFCGGFQVQWGVNGGKCGVCGDPYNAPREHEAPNGKYARKLMITKTYKSGSIIDAKVQLTANHRGFFTFRVCPATESGHEVTQQCLDKYVLEMADSGSKYGRKSGKYSVPSYKPGVFDVRLKLPKGLTCARCVMQWTYTAGNNWGKCDNGKNSVGCGPQETFRGCADIRIIGDGSDDRTPEVDDKTPEADDGIEREGPSSGGRPSKPQPKPSPKPAQPPVKPVTPKPSAKPKTVKPYTRKPYAPTKRPAQPTRRPFSVRPSTQTPSTSTSTVKPTSTTRRSWSTRSTFTRSTKRTYYTPSYDKPTKRTDGGKGGRDCGAVGYMRKSPGMSNWCQKNCAKGFCPTSHCICS